MPELFAARRRTGEAMNTYEYVGAKEFFSSYTDYLAERPLCWDSPLGTLIGRIEHTRGTVSIAGHSRGGCLACALASGKDVW